MERLRSSDVRQALELVGDLYTLAPSAGFRRHALDRLRALVPSEMTAWVETRTDGPEATAIASPHDLLPDGPRRFARIRDEHPVLAHFERHRHGAARTMSDFFTSRQFHRQRCYQEFFRPAGIEHQISIALPSRGPRLIRITLNRARGDFGARDRLLLDLLRPHIARAWRTARPLDGAPREDEALAQVTDAAGARLVRVRGARIAFATPRARQLLSVYCGGRRAAHRVPEVVSRWLGAWAPPGTNDVPPPRDPLVLERDGGILEIRPLSVASGHLLVLRERITRVDAPAIETLGLTRRQAEVLAWLAQGKANRDIATILAISPHTVGRHVEAIFAVLGVQTRTAAAAAALAHVSG